MARPTDERTKRKYERKKPRPAHMWQPGQSGNPGGFSKKAKARVAELAAMSADYTDVVFRQFEDMLRDPETKPETRLAICRELLDRGYGRPTQGLSIFGDLDQDPIQAINLTPEQFREIVEAGRKLDDDV